MGSNHSDVFASAETLSDRDEDLDTWSAQAFHRSGVLVWIVPDEAGPVRAEWVPFPDDDGPTLLTNMEPEQRERLGLPDAAWAELCSGLAVDERRRGEGRLDRASILGRLARIDDTLSDLERALARSGALEKRSALVLLRMAVEQWTDADRAACLDVPDGGLATLYRVIRALEAAR